MDEKMATCRKCHIEKKQTEFARTSTNRSGYRTSCSECYAMYMREYYKKNPDKYQKQKEYVARNDREYKRSCHRHGLTKDQFDAMMCKYDGMCWGCKTKPAVSIDHDHKHCPGQFGCIDCVRGILCIGCNSALGFVDDSTETLSKLIEYLVPSGGVPAIL